MRVHASIDGRGVDLDDGWQADAAVDWGYRTFTGRVPDTVTWAEQEAPMQLWLDDGSELWAGKLSLDPQPERGKLAIRAEGYAADIEASPTRMFYRLDGTEAWANAEDDPHNYAGAEQEIDAEVRPVSLWIRLRKGEIITSGSNRGFALWLEGATMTRYAFTHIDNIGAGNDWRTDYAIGPDGAGTLIANHTFVSGSVPTAVAQDFDGSDLLTIQYRRSGATTAALGQTFFGRIVGLKVYGRTTDDAFSAGEVVADVGATDGFGTGLVRAHALPMLPLDWTEDHPELLTYIGELTDWHWEALGPDDDGIPQLAFGPYETTWTGFQADGLVPQWENQKRYNRVQVPYIGLSGREGSRMASPTDDPFPGREVVYITEPLENPQPNGDLAEAAAAAQADYRAAKKVAGRAKIGRVFSEAREATSGYKVRPGHLLDVADRPDLGPQRIVGVSWGAKEDVTVEVNEDFNVIRMLKQLQREQKKGRRRKGRKRR